MLEELSAIDDGENMSYKTEKIFSYSLKDYNFVEIIEKLFSCNNLQKIHESSNNKYDLFSDPLKDSETEFHNTVYSKLRTGWPEFLNMYRLFLLNEVLPNIQTEMGLIYQTWPTFRFHLPNNVAVGGWHTDRSYNHPPDEINFIVPLTPMFESNAVITESEPGKKDFHQIECIPGQYVRFNGNECMHGNLPNRTNVTRVSFDFRVMRLEDYNPDAENQSLTMGKKYRIGGYYEVLK